jgi:hypothetical protein
MLLRLFFHILSKKLTFLSEQSKYFKEENVRERERESERGVPALDVSFLNGRQTRKTQFYDNHIG